MKISLSILAKREKNLRGVSAYAVKRKWKKKTKSGIQGFQEEKKYGTFFGNLMPFVSSMHSCQLQQATEPSNIEQLETTEPTDESLQVVQPMIPAQRANVKALSFQFMKTLKGKENIQSLNIWFLKFMKPWTTSGRH